MVPLNLLYDNTKFEMQYFPIDFNQIFFTREPDYLQWSVSHYEGSPKSTRPNKENPDNLEKNNFISQRSLLLAQYTFPNDVQ